MGRMEETYLLFLLNTAKMDKPKGSEILFEMRKFSNARAKLPTAEAFGFPAPVRLKKDDFYSSSFLWGGRYFRVSP